MVGLRKMRGKKREKRGEWERKREGEEEGKKTDIQVTGASPSDLRYSLIPTGMLEGGTQRKSMQISGPDGLPGVRPPGL